MSSINPPFIASVTTLDTPGTNPAEFKATATIKFPSDVTHVFVQAWGAGGGGGGDGHSNTGFGGGGGGAFASGVVTVTGGGTYTVTVGTGGAGDNVSGGNSSFTGDSGSTVVAAGGGGGGGAGHNTGGAGGSTASSTGATKFKGGDGGTGFNSGGALGAGGGGGAGSAGAGSVGGSPTNTSSFGVGGNGGTPDGGKGGDGGGFNSQGNAGVFPGGGVGGSGSFAGSGASGGGGYVVISWGAINPPGISSVTTVYVPSALTSQFTVPFISSTTAVHAPTIPQVDPGFIPSRTSVYGLFSVYSQKTGVGPGNGGETAQVQLAPSGSTVTATLSVSLTSSDSLLTLSSFSGLPSSGSFVVTIDSEVIYVTVISAGSYRIRSRAASNTVAASHTAGASVAWSDTYDMSVVATAPIASSFTANITGTGSQLYQGWLICFDSSQAYLSGSRYPAHVAEVLGVFPPGAGSAGTNRLDASQPNSVCTPTGISDDCPAALSNPALISSDIFVDDVALLRYQNTEASTLTLGPRAASLQSWFGIYRVDSGNNDVTYSDPTGHSVDGTINGEFFNPSSVGIAPDTGLPTAGAVPYTSPTLPGSSRAFTHAGSPSPPNFADKGWPIGVLSVRQGNRRVPKWASYDWSNYNFVFSGFDPDCTFAQMVVNVNGLLYGTTPTINLPGPQDISGPDAVWDDGSYYFGVSWYVVLLKASYLTLGPGVGGGVVQQTYPPGSQGVPPAVSFGSGGGGGGPGPPTVILPPIVFGGSGGDIPAPVVGSKFQAEIV